MNKPEKPHDPITNNLHVHLLGKAPIIHIRDNPKKIKKLRECIMFTNLLFRWMNKISLASIQKYYRLTYVVKFECTCKTRIVNFCPCYAWNGTYLQNQKNEIFLLYSSTNFCEQAIINFFLPGFMKKMKKLQSIRLCNVG